MTNTSQVRKLTTLEVHLLSKIYEYNLRGEMPTKATVCRDRVWQAKRTVAYRYRVVDRLIANDLVGNSVLDASGSIRRSGWYKLFLTASGIEALNA